MFVLISYTLKSELQNLFISGVQVLTCKISKQLTRLSGARWGIPSLNEGLTKYKKVRIMTEITEILIDKMKVNRKIKKATIVYRTLGGPASNSREVKIDCFKYNNQKFTIEENKIFLVEAIFSKSRFDPGKKLGTIIRFLPDKYAPLSRGNVEIYSNFHICYYSVARRGKGRLDKVGGVFVEEMLQLLKKSGVEISIIKNSGERTKINPERASYQITRSINDLITS